MILSHTFLDPVTIATCDQNLAFQECSQEQKLGSRSSRSEVGTFLLSCLFRRYPTGCATIMFHYNVPNTRLSSFIRNHRKCYQSIQAVEFSQTVRLGGMKSQEWGRSRNHAPNLWLSPSFIEPFLGGHFLFFPRILLFIPFN